MRGTNDSRRDYSPSQSSTQERDVENSFSCVEIIIILDPVRQRFLFLVSIFSRFIIIFFLDLLRITYKKQQTNKKRKGNLLRKQNFFNELIKIKKVFNFDKILKKIEQGSISIERICMISDLQKYIYIYIIVIVSSRKLSDSFFLLTLKVSIDTIEEQVFEINQ